MAIGFGIVGCGMIANFHARAIADIRGAKLVGAYSRRIESAKEFVTEHGGTAYDSLQDMLENPEIDVIRYVHLVVHTWSQLSLQPTLKNM